MSFIDWNDEIDWTGWNSGWETPGDYPTEIASLGELAKIYADTTDELIAILCGGVSLDPWQHCDPQRDGRAEWLSINRMLDDLIYDGLRLPR